MLDKYPAESSVSIIRWIQAFHDPLDPGVSRHSNVANSRLDVGLGCQHIPPMTDPFVQPEEPTAAAAIEAISEDLTLFDDWMERYEFIIGMGRKLPPFPDDWANDAHRVPGCQSRVWMEAIPRDGKLYFAGISDAAIVSGLIALLLRVYSGRSPDEILATDPVFLKDLGLLEALSTNRGNGTAVLHSLAAPDPAMPRSNVNFG